MVEVFPSRTFISDRFPVASFVVHAPPERVFEIACATHPSLLAAENRSQRTPANFYSSRAEGLMRAPQGMATWLVPSDQLSRFAGSPRLFYAVAHYGGTAGQDVQTSIPAGRTGAVPFIRLASDFTGRSLDRSRFGAKGDSGPRYGSAKPGSLVWGGDAAPARRYGDPEPDYDDGYDPTIWGSAQAQEEPAEVPDPEPPGLEDATEVYAQGQGTPAPVPLLGARLGARTKEAPVRPNAAPPRSNVAARTKESPARTNEPPASRYGNAAVHAEPHGDEHPPTRIGSARPTIASARPTYGDAAQPLGIREKLEIVRKVGAIVAPGGYTTTAVEGSELVWGLVGFRQSTGGIGAVLDLLRSTAADVLTAVFGASADALVSALVDPARRMSPVEGLPLTDASWQARFTEAARTDAVKFAQNRAAVERLLDPVLPALTTPTDRNLGIALAVASWFGPDEAARLVAGGMETLDARVQGTPFAERLAALRASPTFTDALYERG